YGLAVQRTKGKEALLGVCDVVYRAGILIWQWVVRAAPGAVFALMAATAGTVRVQALSGLAVYVGLFTAGCLLLGLWILPALLAAMAPVPLRGTFARMRPALVMALTTTLPLVALPYVQEVARDASGDDADGVAE